MKPNIEGKERRGLSFELRMDTKEDGTQMFRGHAAVFDSPSELLAGCFREIIKPGAFTEALKVSDVRALWNHNPDHVLGRTSSGTLRMKEDETGLSVEIDLPDTTAGRDLRVSMERKDVKEMSFAFKVADGGDIWTRDADDSGNWTRTIGKFERIYDASPVTYPAYPETDCALRSLEGAKAKEVPKVNDSYLRRLRLDLEAAL